MRTRAITGFLLALLVLSGCDSDDPLQLTGKSTAISFSANGALVNGYDVFFLTEDSDNNGSADDFTGDGTPDTQLFCAYNGAQVSSGPISWGYAVDISILSEGAVVPTQLTSNAAATGANLTPSSLTSYTSNASIAPILVTHTRGCCGGPSGACTNNNNPVLCNPNGSGAFCPAAGAGTQCNRRSGCCGVGGACSDPADPVFCNPSGNFSFCGSTVPGTTCQPQNFQVTRRFVFSGPRRLPASHPEVIASTSNILSQIDPATFDDGGASIPAIPPPGTEDGLCPGFPVGMPNLDGGDTTLPVELKAGDTIIVEARRATLSPYGLLFSNVDVLAAPSFGASFVVDGQPLAESDVEGNFSAGNDPAGSVQFFFTLR